LLKATQPERLERAIDRFNGELSPLKEFILPGGTRAAALTHVCRATCRRAEREVVELAATETVADTSRQYLNRLSDLLFVLARWLNKHSGRGDVMWQKGKNQ
jgi:cob(I)alamin adenosyltransferase